MERGDDLDQVEVDGPDPLRLKHLAPDRGLEHVLTLPHVPGSRVCSPSSQPKACAKDSRTPSAPSSRTPAT